MSRPAQDGRIGFDGNEHVDDDYRRSTIRWLDHQGAENDIAKKIMSYVYDANRECFGVDIWDMFLLQFTEYQASANGKYDWHHDVDFLNRDTFERKLSVVVQLSDPSSYDGGDFEFYNMSQPHAFRLQGSIIVFPSFFNHRVTPVTRGTRHSLVTWIDGPKWR